jgi:hypothetical protein
MYTYGNVTRKLPVKLPLSQTSKMSSFSFFFYKIREQEGCKGWGGVGTTGNREVGGKGHRRVNTVQKMCTHVCKC